MTSPFFYPQRANQASARSCYHSKKDMRLDTRLLGFAFVALLVVAGILLVGWHYFKSSPATPAQTIKGLTGKIYLSLVPLPESQNNLSVYSFDLSSGQLSPFLSDKGVDYLTSKFSPDGSQFAYSHIGATMDLVLQTSSEGKMVLTGDPTLKIRRNPVWSPDGSKIAYAARADLQGSSFEAAEWLVYVFDLKSGREQVITNGSNPLFAPDGSLLVLKSDGLYRFDLDSLVGEKIWDTGSEASQANMKLALSSDGKYLAWGVPDRREVVVIEIQSWQPFKGTVLKILPVTAFWPVFSPDGSYLALEEVDPGTLTNPRLVVHAVQSDAQETLLSLKDYAQDALFISDWR